MGNWILWLIIGIGLISPLLITAGSLRKLFLGWRTPTTWISALPTQGWVEVLGKIRNDPIKSLLNKSDCSYWQLEVQEYQSSGRGGGRWRTVYKQSSGNFMIDDMTGRIQVMDGNTNLITNNETVVDKPDQATKDFLESLGVKTTGFLGFGKRLRIFERLIAPDEEIVVLGRLQKSPTPVTISGNDLLPLVISTMDRSEMNKALFWKAVGPMLLAYGIIIGVIFLLIFLR